MTRSIKKWFYVNAKLLKKVQAMNEKGEKKIIKVRDRASQITPEMLDFTFAVHNGKGFTSVYITENMLLHRLWEFAFTRTFRGHPF